MVSEFEVAIRLAAAVAAGSVLGWERETQNKPAGLKTHMLVALGSAGFMLGGLELHEQLIARNQASNADVMKVLGGIVGGIGFLGAGAILRSRADIHGLTTAATIWIVAAIGVACGLGLYFLAATSLGLAIVILLGFGFVERIYFEPVSRPGSADSRASKADGAKSADTGEVG